MRPTKPTFITASAILILLVSSFKAVASTITTTDGKEKLRLEPYLNYRQASVSLRRSSAMFDPEKDRDYVDQVYLSLRIVKEFPDIAIAMLEPSISNFRENPSEIEVAFDQAFVDANLSETFHFIAGVRQETRGAGSFFSPSDLPNSERDFIDPLVRRRGHHMTRMEWRSGTTKLGLGYLPAPGKGWKQGRTWFLGESSLWDTDLTLQATFQDEQKFERSSVTYDEPQKARVGFSAARFFGETFELHIDGRYQQRQENLTKQPERSYSAVPLTSSSQWLVVGSRVVFTSTASVVGEYIKNSTGLNPGELRSYYESKFEPGAVKDDPFTRLVGREYASLSFYDDKLLTKLRASLSSIYNIRDHSTFVLGALKYRASSLFTLSYTPVFFVGEKFTEFGENPARAVHYLNAEATF